MHSDGLGQLANASKRIRLVIKYINAQHISHNKNYAALGDKVNIPLGTIVAPHGGPTGSGADSAPPIGKGMWLARQSRICVVIFTNLGTHSEHA